MPRARVLNIKLADGKRVLAGKVDGVDVVESLDAIEIRGVLSKQKVQSVDTCSCDEQGEKRRMWIRRRKKRRRRRRRRRRRTKRGLCVGKQKASGPFDDR